VPNCVSRAMLKDPELQKFLDENEGKILELRKWAAREITKERMGREHDKAKLAGLCADASAKVDIEWFCSINHPKKEKFKDIVMLNIQCTGISILDNDPDMVDELFDPERKVRYISDELFD
jgi:hypothetical protein